MAIRNVRKTKIPAEGKKSSRLTKAVLLLLLGVLLVEVFVTWDATSKIGEKARPANLEIIQISDNTCVQCASVNLLSAPISGSNSTKILSTSTIDFASAEAKSLIAKYGVQKIPAVVVTGEFKKDNVVFLWGDLGGKMLTDAVIIETSAPFVNATNGHREGLVSLVSIVDSSCANCTSMDDFVSSLKQTGVNFVSEKTIEYTSSEAQAWITSQDIQRIPAIVFSKDIETYDTIKQFLVQTNATERQGFYAYHSTSPPYLDLGSGKVVGLVSVIYITDASCTTCYDVYGHRAILQRFGITVVNETTYDIANTMGNQLITQYNITKVPTILISPDGAYYANLKQVWPPVGTIASDGWFVFIGTEAMGTYKDLASGQIVASTG